MRTPEDPRRLVRIVCDPAEHDLARLILRGGELVLTGLPLDVGALVVDQEVELTDGVVIAAATARKYYAAYDAWAFRVQPYLPGSR